MTLDEYQQHALTTALKTDDKFMDMMHWVLGMAGESGEVADKLKKIIRDKGGTITPADEAELVKEIGDVLWYVAVMADQLGVSLNDVAQANVDKLASRKSRGTLAGSGDNR